MNQPHENEGLSHLRGDQIEELAQNGSDGRGCNDEPESPKL